MKRNIYYVALSFAYINIIGLVFHFFVSRQLSPKGYGEFIVLYSLINSVGNLSTLLIPVSVKLIIKYFSEKEAVLRYLRILAISLGCAFLLAGIMFSPLIKAFLNISTVYFIWIVAVSWFLLFITSIEKGYLQSQSLFGDFAIINGAEFTVRLLTAIAFLYAGFHILGVLYASLLGLIFSFALLLLKNKNIVGAIRRLGIKEILFIASFNIPVGFFIYADDMFIRRIFDEHTAGIFASISVLGKAVILFCMTLFSVFFPKIVEHKDSRKFVSYSVKIFLIVILILFISEIMVFAAGKHLYLLLFGDKYIEGFAFAPYYILAIVPLVLSLMLIGIFTAIEKFLKIIYLHLISYYAGFGILSFGNISTYILYIFAIHFAFMLVYFCLLYYAVRQMEKSGLNIAGSALMQLENGQNVYK